MIVAISYRVSVRFPRNFAIRVSGHQSFVSEVPHGLIGPMIGRNVRRRGLCQQSRKREKALRTKGRARPGRLAALAYTRIASIILPPFLSLAPDTLGKRQFGLK